MKKFIIPLIIIFISVSCKQLYMPPSNLNKFTIPPGDSNLTKIPGRYIVFMNERYENPIIDNRKNRKNRVKQQLKNQDKRERKVNNLKRYLEEKVAKNDKNLFFADVQMMAIMHLNQQEADVLSNDPKVRKVIQDISIQINPIQQTPGQGANNPLKVWFSAPVANINPIQQNDGNEKMLHGVDPSNNTSYAVLAAGGYSTAGNNTRNIIWILDTGIDTLHKSLNVQTALASSLVGGSPLQDANGHGTFCAGVAASDSIGTNPSLPFIHIGVSERAKVVPVKVLDDAGRGSWGSVLAGLDHVAQFSKRGDVVNLSLGAYDPSNPTCNYPDLKSALYAVTTINRNERVFVTLSAGNDASLGGNALFNSPGCIDAANLFTASSIDSDNTCALYANFGQPPVDYVTVGTRVFSLWGNGTFRMASGTSISSAVLAGILHAGRGAPLSGTPQVTCSGKNYSIAKWR
jgi:subtilisin family serine protease